jgi:hydroxyquinol 1,2-dioxygenase
VGDLLRMQVRHNLRPAHIHFLIAKPGFKTQFAQVYSSDDENLETNVVFAVTTPLVGRYVAQAEDGWLLTQRFVLQAEESRLRVPPISGKTDGPRPRLEVLQRRWSRTSRSAARPVPVAGEVPTAPMTSRWR